MYRIANYIVCQIIPWQILALVGVILAFVTTQLLRVMPVFAGAGAGVFEAAYALGLLLVPVTTWALTPAFLVAVFSTAGRMSADGELTALDASGLSRARLAIGPAVLALMISFLSAWLWLDAAPRSQIALRSVAVDLAIRALAGQIEPGRFFSPLSGITFFADSKNQERGYKGVFLEDARNPDRPVQIVAKDARIQPDPSRWILSVYLENGTAFYPADDTHAAVSFESLIIEVPLTAEIERRLDFFPYLLAVPTGRLMGPTLPGIASCDWHFALWRRVAGPLGFIVLSLLSVLLAFGVTWRRRGIAVAVAAVLFLMFHLLCRLGESLMQAQVLGAFSAALLPVLAVAVVPALLLALQLRRGGARIKSSVRQLDSRHIS
ncbi:MAG: YjgP/YjgQ family permease [Proteobacteria bacterium]|nr:YjgP/YjgQ family permease [Pseudomonadota bacterium]